LIRKQNRKVELLKVEELKRSGEFCFESLAFSTATTITSSDEVNELLEGVFLEDAVGSFTDSLLDSVLVVAKITVKVGLEVPVELSPVDGSTSDVEGSSEIDGDRVEGSFGNDQSGKLDLSGEVEEN